MQFADAVCVFTYRLYILYMDLCVPLMVAHFSHCDFCLPDS